MFSIVVIPQVSAAIDDRDCHEREPENGEERKKHALDVHAGDAVHVSGEEAERVHC